MSLDAVTIMCVISAVAGQPSMRDNPLANTKQANLCQPFFGAIAPSLPTVLLVRFYWLRKAAARPVFNIILPLGWFSQGAMKQMAQGQRRKIEIFTAGCAT